MSGVKLMKTLFDTAHIGPKTLSNRFVRSATWERRADKKGHMTESLLWVYEELAAGDIGLIITGYAFVLEEEQPNPQMMGIYDDSFINEYRSLTGRVHELGGSIVMQIAYGGTRTTFHPEGRVIWGPSAVPEYSTGVVAQEMTLEDIRTLIRAFAAAADRAKQAGFDGVQLHAAHGYFLGQFLSPYHNLRTDAYGGGIENRARIVLETFKEVRQKVGVSFPVMIKINSEDGIPEGATFQDCQYVCSELARMGIDAIEVSGDIRAAEDPCCLRGRVVVSEADEAYFAAAAAKIAEDINVPVILVGGLRSPGVMQHLLETTKISFFSMSRPFLAEPHLVRRWKSGDMSRSRCLSCNQCRTPKGNYCTVFR